LHGAPCKYGANGDAFVGRFTLDWENGTMNVWRKQTIRYRLNGRNVPKGTAKAKRERIESKRFYGTLRLASGKRKQVPLTEAKDTSETLLRRLQCDEDTKRANGADRFYDDRKRPVAEFLTEFGSYLQAKGNTALHVSTTLSRCTALLTATKTKTIADFDAGRVLKTLAGWRSRKSKPISVATSNHYLIAIKSFSRWLWQERKSPDDPLAGLRRLNAETDRKRIRRPLTPSELDTLLSVAHQSTRTFRGADWQFTGTDRSMLYAIAAFTGLRAGECSRLTKASFDFDAGTWTLPASATKNRKAVTLPLAPALANRLQPWLATLKRDVLFPGDWVADAKCFAGKFLKRDMKRAGIPYRDATGRVADFHSLRYTFITTLAKAGVHPAKAQRLARHSTVTLTMNVYTSLDVDDLREAVSAIGADSNPPLTPRT
jgi:integrase